jgi:hypothetical protein
MEDRFRELKSAMLSLEIGVLSLEKITIDTITPINDISYNISRVRRRFILNDLRRRGKRI